MIDTRKRVLQPAAGAAVLDVHLSRYGRWYYFDVRSLFRQPCALETTVRAGKSVARVMAAIAVSYNAALPMEMPIFFVTAKALECSSLRTGVVDVTNLWSGTYTVLATKDERALAELIETVDAYGMVFPAGIRPDLWLQLGENAWDFILNDPKANELREPVLLAFAREGMNLIATSPSPKIDRKVFAEKAVADFSSYTCARNSAS